jgi:hypothetical protein
MAETRVKRAENTVPEAFHVTYERWKGQNPRGSILIRGSSVQPEPRCLLCDWFFLFALPGRGRLETRSGIYSTGYGQLLFVLPGSNDAYVCSVKTSWRPAPGLSQVRLQSETARQVSLSCRPQIPLTRA